MRQVGWTRRWVLGRGRAGHGHRVRGFQYNTSVALVSRRDGASESPRRSTWSRTGSLKLHSA
eukprot:213747-Rhodomonas_salina.1